MKRYFVVLMVLMAIFSVLSSAKAQDDSVKPTWLLVGDENGEILVVETTKEYTLVKIKPKDGFAFQPFWSPEGDKISFITTRTTYFDDEPIGVAAWVNFEGDLEINLVPRCTLSDVVCTNASFNSQGWLVFTAIRKIDQHPLLYAYNVESGDLDPLQSGGFYPETKLNRWISDTQYIVQGEFSESYSTQARIFDVPKPGVTTRSWDYVKDSTYPTQSFGCNGEVAEQLWRGSRERQGVVKIYANLEALEAKEDFLGGQGVVLSPADPWRDCNAPEPTFAEGIATH
jgi:hypothetical protein